MKRTYKRPDGTEETLEGTAEELALYEQEQIKKGVASIPETTTPKPGILHGKPEVDGVPLTDNEVGFIRTLRLIKPLDSAPLQPIIQPYTWPDTVPQWPYESGPIWQVGCSICGMINCAGHNSGFYYKFGDVMTKTVTVTGNSAIIGTSDDTYKLS